MLKKMNHLAFTIYLSIYAMFSAITLLTFPFVHSDEPWLAGLSLEYIKAKSIFVTEPFFDLMPREPHAIKSLFHLLQTAFISIFGYSITSVRSISLLCGIIVLIQAYILFLRVSKDIKVSLIVTILLSLNLQFIYASHFARQEMILCLFLFAALLATTNTKYSIKKRVVLSGMIIGVSIGFHPNAFMIGMVIGFIWLYDVMIRKASAVCLLIYAGIIGFSGIFFVGLSLFGNPQFFQDYWTYGKTLNVDAAFPERLNHFFIFYNKLYEQVSGTYYLPDLKVFFMVSAGLILASLLFKTELFRKICKDIRQKALKINTNHKAITQSGNLQTVNDQQSLSIQISRTAETKVLGEYPLVKWLLGILGFNLALFIVGRYNPTSIIFLVLLVHLLFVQFLTCHNLTGKKTVLILILAILISFGQTFSEIYKSRNDSYQYYLSEISENLPTDAIVLGNLNSGFAFKDRDFYDIRNLYYLEDETVEQYIKTRGINTIIYYENYDYIHRNKQWLILYGDDRGYYDDLNAYIKENGTLLHEFASPVYGNRIVRYINDYPWKVWIYHVQ